MQTLNRPQAIVIEQNCRNNIKKLKAKARSNKADCRPHFKTHQSHIVGNWFKEEGISAITVSSPQMAAYFMQYGWSDISIAFPFYKTQIHDINNLARNSSIRLFVDEVDKCRYLSLNLEHPVGLMIEIDAGYNRSGLPYQDLVSIDELITEIKILPNISFKGFYIHDGGTYSVKGKNDVQRIIQRDLEAFKFLLKHYPDATYGIGDTPSCSLIDDLYPATEISPGNLIFYDLMQIEIGSCSFNDIGLLVRVPVVQEKVNSDECIIHGGAVHFSKERLIVDGNETFGQPVLVSDEGKISKIGDTFIKSLSQEHGIVSGLQALKKAYNTETLKELWICPVHSCLTANLFDSYVTLNNKSIEKRVLS